MNHELMELAAALRAVSGVSSADVEPDASGSPDALRLRLVPGADGVEVARLAGQLLAEHLGRTTPSCVVNIVVQGAEPVAPLEPQTPSPVVIPAQRPPRLSVGRTDVVTDGLESAATVALSSATASATGRARGVSTRAGMNQAVAQATLRALEQLLTSPAKVGLDTLMTAPVGDRSTVLISLTLVTAAGVEQLTGSAIVRQDESAAVVRATLNALNRRLESLLG